MFIPKRGSKYIKLFSAGNNKRKSIPHEQQSRTGPDPVLVRVLVKGWRDLVEFELRCKTLQVSEEQDHLQPIRGTWADQRSSKVSMDRSSPLPAASSSPQHPRTRDVKFYDAF